MTPMEKEARETFRALQNKRYNSLASESVETIRLALVAARNDRLEACAQIAELASPIGTSVIRAMKEE